MTAAALDNSIVRTLHLSRTPFFPAPSPVWPSGMRLWIVMERGSAPGAGFLGRPSPSAPSVAELRKLASDLRPAIVFVDEADDIAGRLAY